jgi:ankyrin repeat protein
MNESEKIHGKYIVYILFVCAAIVCLLAVTYFERERKIQEFFDILAADNTARAKVMLEKEPRLMSARDKEKRTALFYAGSKEMAELLIANGADINAKSALGTTPLHDKAVPGLIDVMELLISKGADVNAKDNNGITPLHIAADLENVETVELLIKNGAMIDVKDSDGYTPLRIATKKNHPAVADLLRKHGAKE